MHKEKLPLLGIAAFVILYGYATTLYPGGHQADLHAPGFDWLHNYWCDLLGVRAGNGQSNPARPVAMLAMVILGATLAFFWYSLAGFLHGNRRRRATVRFSGIVSMASACLLFTPQHDTALVISGVTAFVALVATFSFLRQGNQTALLYFGVFCMALFVVTNAIYWLKTGLAWLPIVQKITLTAFLLWTAKISLLFRGD